MSLYFFLRATLSALPDLREQWTADEEYFLITESIAAKDMWGISHNSPTRGTSELRL